MVPALLGGLMATLVLFHVLSSDWLEYTVACGSAALMSSLAVLPKRYLTEPPSEKPWRLVKLRRP